MVQKSICAPTSSKSHTWPFSAEARHSGYASQAPPAASCAIVEALGAAKPSEPPGKGQ